MEEGSSMSKPTANSDGGRRRFLRLAAVGFGGLALAACGGSATAPSGNAATAAPSDGSTSSPVATVGSDAVAPAQGGTAQTAVTVWYWDKVFDASVAAFQQAHPNITVKFEPQPFADVHDKLLTSFASGSGAPDVTSIAIDRIGAFTAKGGLVDLKNAPFDGGQFEKDMVSYKWTQASTADGRLVAMPWDIGPAGFWYRADVFEAAGYPTEPEEVAALISGSEHTWEDFLAFAKEFRAKTGGKTALFADAQTDIYAAAYRQQGEGLQDGAKLLIEEKLTRPYQLAAQARRDTIDANIAWWGAEWATGLIDQAFAGMMIACWMQGFVTRDQPETVGQWRLVPAPERGYNFGGSFMAIPEQSKNQEAAWELIKYVCASAEGQNLLFKSAGFFPAYKPAWQDPLYDEPVDFFGGQKAFRVWADIADTGEAIFRTPNDVQLEDIAGAELTKVLQEGKDPVQAAKDAEAEALKRVEGTQA
jgi:multiple sugar transport system substrate-binding protein